MVIVIERKSKHKNLYDPVKKLKKCTLITCRRFNIWLPLNQFHKHKSVLGGVRPECGECSNLLKRARKYGFVDKNGITLIEDLLNFVNYPNSKCKICLRPLDIYAPKRTSKTLCIDHCHDTGKTREALCLSCNSILGRGIEILKKIIAYQTLWDEKLNGV